ncbi:hypothetical protein WAX74_15085 [Psychrobacillus sp. FJAT-51614]|uniref:Uncharacterized protein n=1 Tax=Psychrobacillus mangrovi TaxID=3117745 RepID=A0ABU8F7L0_9BACI
MKKYAYNFSIIFLALFSATMIYLNVEAKKSERKLEAVVGNSVYNVWVTLNEISSDGEITFQNIEKTNEKLITAEVFAGIIDRSVSVELLQPIIKNLLVIGESIENNYYKNNEFTKENQEIHKEYLTEVQKTISAIYDIYYVPNSEGKVKLEIKNFDELTEINKRLLEIQKK